MDPMRIAIRCFAGFVFLLVMVRLSGKRIISQSTPFDFVLALVIGDLVDDLLFSEVPGSTFVVAAGTLVIADLIVRIAGFHSSAFDSLVGGRPAILIRDGKTQNEQLQKEQLRSKDWLSLLRQKGFDEQTMGELKLAILEPTGEPSTLRKKANQTVQKKHKEALIRSRDS